MKEENFNCGFYFFRKCWCWWVQKSFLSLGESTRTRKWMRLCIISSREYSYILYFLKMQHSSNDKLSFLSISMRSINETISHAENKGFWNCSISIRGGLHRIHFAISRLLLGTFSHFFPSSLHGKKAKKFQSIAKGNWAV